MPKLTLLVGPPGSGKSSLAHKFIFEDGDHGLSTQRISQDDQGKHGHAYIFADAIDQRKDIIVDRMNFDVHQRKRYLEPAKVAGYETEIIVLHENYDTCLARCLKREGHPTIRDETNAKSALNMFFGKYERVQDGEADKVTRIWPDKPKPEVVICDLDGTLCNVDHRLEHVRHVILDDKKVQKKNWPRFFAELDKDTPNEWCEKLIRALDQTSTNVIYCSGRPDSYRKPTEEWLVRHKLGYRSLFMRNRSDSRKDSIAKEIILDFEILTRWTPLFAIDDRSQVVQMWRSRGITTLQCAEGNF